MIHVVYVSEIFNLTCRPGCVDGLNLTIISSLFVFDAFNAFCNSKRSKLNDPIQNDEFIIFIWILIKIDNINIKYHLQVKI